MAMIELGSSNVDTTRAAFDQMLSNSQRNAEYARRFMLEGGRTTVDISAKKFAFNLAVKSRIEGSSTYYKLIDEAIKKSGGAGG